MDVAERSEQFGERVLVVRLLERHVPFRVGVVAEDVGDLLQDQDHADGGQQALDHAGREEGGDEPGPSESQADLDQPGEDHGQQERLERPQDRDLGGHDRRQPAAGPLTLVCDPLSIPTRMPPTIPASTPENSGALDARATPRHNGRATRNTTRPEVTSEDKIANVLPFADCMETTFFLDSRLASAAAGEVQHH